MYIKLGTPPTPLPHPFQASIVAALSSDLGKVQQLLEQTSEQLAADPVASVQVGGEDGPELRRGTSLALPPGAITCASAWG